MVEKLDQVEREWFREFLQRASEEVASWPPWKRGILEASSRQFNEHERGEAVNVTVLRRKSPTSVEWDMVFRDQEFINGDTAAVITRIQDYCPCQPGDELIIIMDDRAERVIMSAKTLQAVWFPMKRHT